jgi:hypothetical protein
VGPLNLALWIGGIALMVIGYSRARGPYARLRALQATDENLRRYENWRGARRAPDEPGGVTGAEVMRGEMRRQVQLWVAVAAVGFVLVFAGFALRP